MKDVKMYYDRTVSDAFIKIIKQGGELKWLFDFVKENDCLDFLIGKNNSKEWISIYRGLSRLITISMVKNIKDDIIIQIDGAEAYKKITPKLYGKRYSSDNFKNHLTELLLHVEKDKKFDRYYNNKKEGFYQSELSRNYGLSGSQDADFVIIDKEAVIGYDNQIHKNRLYKPLQSKYKKLQELISIRNHERYGRNLEKKFIGNELDFIALDKDGNILLIEYKHGTNTSGIYLSPLQIGLYYDLFTSFPREGLNKSILSQLKQKQEIGLINPNWKIPEELKEIIPVLVISDYNYNSTAKKKFEEILNICKNEIDINFLKNIKTYNYTSSQGLKNW